MGLEILFGVLLILGIGAAVFFPVAFWAVWLSRGQRRLMEGLRTQGIGLLEAKSGDAGTPISLLVDASGHRCEASATVRGTTPLWRVRIERPEPSAHPAVFVHGAWAGRSENARGMDAVSKTGPYLLYHQASEIDGALARFIQAGERLVAYRDAIVEVALTPESIHIEVRRAHLSHTELARWIWVASALLARVDNVAAPGGAMTLPSRSGGASFGGSSVGVAGA